MCQKKVSSARSNPNQYVTHSIPSRSFSAYHGNPLLASLLATRYSLLATAYAVDEDND